MNKKTKLVMLSMPIALFAPVLSASCREKQDFNPKDFKDVTLSLASDGKTDFAKKSPSEFVKENKSSYAKVLEVTQNGSKTDKYGYELVSVRPNDNYGYLYVEYKLFDKNNKKNITPKKFIYLQDFKSNVKEQLSSINSNLYFSKTRNLGPQLIKKHY
nr:hypothetical protein [Mycoplasmopsis bovis]